MTKGFCFFCLFLILPASGDEALNETQHVLTSPQAREEAIRNDPNAQRINEQVKQLAGSDANTEEIYGLSSEIFSRMVEKAGGDIQKLQKMILHLEKHPEQINRYMSAKDKTKLNKLGNKIIQTSNPKTQSLSP